MPPFVDITGKKFGRLTALHPTDERSGSGNVVWQCRCDCGATPLVYGNHLRNGNTTSCGCMKIEMFTDMATTHGMGQTLTYRIWAGMMQRCYNPNDTSYEMYGGRGRTADKSWHKFEGFFADMGECPEG